MDFGQQVILELVKAIATASLVTVLGAIAAQSWSKRHDRRQEESRLRTELLNEIAHTGQGMYIFLQHSTRKLIQQRESSGKDSILEELDAKFLEFSTRSAQLHTLIGARFGVVRASADDLPSLPPFLRWHQVHDLLSLYYYNLKEFFPRIVLAETEKGYSGNYHSGLYLGSYRENGKNMTDEDLRRMRHGIRTAFDEAMIDLAQSITTSKMISA